MQSSALSREISKCVHCKQRKDSVAESGRKVCRIVGEHVQQEAVKLKNMTPPPELCGSFSNASASFDSRFLIQSMLIKVSTTLDLLCFESDKHMHGVGWKTQGLTIVPLAEGSGRSRREQ